MDPTTLLLVVAFLTLAFVVLAEGTILGVLWFIVVPGTRRTKKFFDALTMEEADQLTAAAVEFAREQMKRFREQRQTLLLMQREAELEAGLAHPVKVSR